MKRFVPHSFLSIVCSFFIVVGNGQPVDAAPPVTAEELKIERYVSIDNVCAWPNLTVLKDGTIVAVIFSEPSHGLMEGDAECWTSRDGLFWEKRGVVAPNDPHTIRMNVAAGLAGNGDLLALCSGWTDVKQPNLPKQSPFRDAILGAWVCRSSDGGKSWTQEKSFVESDPGWTPYIPFGDIHVGEKGKLHVSCYGGEYSEPTRSAKRLGYRSWHFESEDDGRTWKRTSTIGEKHNETTLFPLGGTKWLAAARIDAMEIFRSDDDGKSWQGPLRVTARNEINGHLARLQDGRILLSYGVRVAGRFGVAAKISSDEGASWSDAITLVDDLANSDCGYPSSTQRPDGRIVTAYYARETKVHQRYHMGTVIWSPPSPSSKD